MSSMFFGCSLLKDLSTFEQINTSNITNMSFLFSLCSKLDLSFLKKWDTSNVTDMSFMFSGCFQLKDLNDLQLNTKNAKYMNGMLAGCLSLNRADKLDLSNAINMSQIFSCCKSLNFLLINNDIGNSKFPKLKDISGMFSNLDSFSDKSIKDISEWKTGNIINMNYLFSFLNNLEKIENLKLDTLNVIDISFLFKGCKKLTSISNININTSNLIDMEGFFEGCSSLKDIKGISNINIKNVKYINSMFENCEKLYSLPDLNWDTSNIIDMNSLFKSCVELTSLKGLYHWNTFNVTNMSNMFNNCKCLSNLSPLKNWDTGNVRDMSSMFSNCKISSLSQISNWNVKNVTNMSSMFEEYFLEYLGSPNVLDFVGYLAKPLLNPFSSTFFPPFYLPSPCNHYLSDLTGLEKWDTSNVKDMKYMFSGCIKISSLSPISHWNIEKAHLSFIFHGISKDLQIPPNFQKKGFILNGFL